MKNLLISLALSLTAGLHGCAMVPRLEAGRSYSDTGRIISRIGDGRCKILIATDHYGFYETELVDYDECARYLPDMPVLIEIYDQGRIRILGQATP